MAVYQGNPLGNLALGLASLRQPGLLSQAIERKAQAPLLAQQTQLGQLQLEQARQQMEQRQRQAQGMERAQGLLGFDPSSMQGAALPQEQLNRQLGSALLQGGQVPAAMGLLAPQAQKPTSLMQEAAFSYPGDVSRQREFIEQVRTTPKTKIDMGAKHIPLAQLPNLQLPGGGDVPIGMTMDEARAAGATFKKKPVATDAAGKQAMIDTALAESANIEKIMFPQGFEGPINNDAIKGMTIKAYTPDFLQPLTAGVSEEGQSIAASFETGIQAITRLETGAAMGKGEIGNTRKRFQPMTWDNDNVKRQKWVAYNLFLNNSKKYFDPNLVKKAKQTGDSTEAVNDAIDKALKDASKQLGGNQPPFSGIGGRPPLSSFERL